MRLNYWIYELTFGKDNNQWEKPLSCPKWFKHGVPMGGNIKSLLTHQGHLLTILGVYTSPLDGILAAQLLRKEMNSAGYTLHLETGRDPRGGQVTLTGLLQGDSAWRTSSVA